MKRVLLIVVILLMQSSRLLACELCQRNQPKILQDVTHGEGPQGQWDYVITWTAVGIVAVVLFFSIKFLVRPSENNPKHIKYIVVNPNVTNYE